MLASWYDRQGPAAGVLEIGERFTREVRVRLPDSGSIVVAPKKRRGWLGTPLASPRFIAKQRAVIDAIPTWTRGKKSVQ